MLTGQKGCGAALLRAACAVLSLLAGAGRTHGVCPVGDRSQAYGKRLGVRGFRVTRTGLTEKTLEQRPETGEGARTHLACSRRPEWLEGREGRGRR